MALADSVLLATDPGFQGRVLAAVVALCESVPTEAVTTGTISQHLAKQSFVARVMQNPSQWQTQFAFAVASDPNIVYAATYGLNGAPAAPTLTTNNLVAQAASIHDADIVTSVAANFTAFYTY